MKRKLTIEIEESEQPEDDEGDIIRYSTEIRVLVDGQQVGLLNRLSVEATAAEHIPKIEVGVLADDDGLFDRLSPEVQTSVRATVEALKPFRCVNLSAPTLA